MQRNVTWNDSEIVCDHNAVSPQFAKQGSYFGSNLKHAPNNNGLMVTKFITDKITNIV